MIISANNKVIKLAMIIGNSFIIIPYINHRKTPRENIQNVKIDISLASFALYIFITWGMNAIVVHIAAAIPIIVWFICFFSSQLTATILVSQYFLLFLTRIYKYCLSLNTFCKAMIKFAFMAVSPSLHFFNKHLVP